MCRFCLNVEGLACCLSVIVSYDVRMYEFESLPKIMHILVKVNGFASSTYELVTIFREISFDKVFSSMKHYDNLIELKTLYSKKSGIVHYFRTYIVLEIGFYLYEMWNESCWVCWKGFHKRCSMAPWCVEIKFYFCFIVM